VEEIKAALSQYSQLQVWKDSQDLLPGQDWESEVFRSLEASNYVLICLSQLGLSKNTFFKREIEWALTEQTKRGPDTVFVIPVRLDDCELPEEMKRLHWVDLFGISRSDLSNQVKSKIARAILIDYLRRKQ
jgi:TIR domain